MELFQIQLNSSATQMMVEAHFSMFRAADSQNCRERRVVEAPNLRSWPVRSARSEDQIRLRYRGRLSQRIS